MESLKPGRPAESCSDMALLIPAYLTPAAVVRAWAYSEASPGADGEARVPGEGQRKLADIPLGCTLHHWCSASPTTASAT